ncbi:hypothetical protein KVV02_000320 [Mortierella alpina]|uniref:Xylanolytic transcriptional activator regulatory domain-containing protein n=1 Tax=Mortierella alpina TaxID=64518 RepID=A0A9P7ZYU7_MORAP|nr:hypothetical protein KVV02_000320 [Mortierella alpina]
MHLNQPQPIDQSARNSGDLGATERLQHNPSNPNDGLMLDHIQLPNANLNVDTGTATVNPYWPQYQPSSHPPALPLNYYVSPTQPATEPILPTPAALPDPPPVAQPSTSKTPMLNQNQVHARTHPWRIKVYNACLACRKKKIKCDGQPTSQQLSPKSAPSLAMDRDTAMLDLYHILVNSVTIPNMYKYAQSKPPGSSTSTGGPPFLMGMDQLNLTLASPMISNFAVMSADQVDPDQNHSSFQKDPTANSFLDQSIPVGFVITNKSVIQYLVHVYFECFHPHWMIVDKEKFMAQLKDAVSPPDPLLLVAICAAGAKYSDHEGLCAEAGKLSSIGEQFLTHARILLQDRFDMPSMSTLQALLILYWCQVQTGRASLRFMYVGMAIRMAQEMGLNRQLDAKRSRETDDREIQIRKTIWWSCYQADRWTSAALGKPMVISDVDCLVDYPASVNDDDRFHIQAFCHMTDLAKILGKVILNLYSATNASTCSSAMFVHLDQSLSAWFEAMPSALDKSGPGDRDKDKDTAPTAPSAFEAFGASSSGRGAHASQQERGRPTSSSSSKAPTPVLAHKDPFPSETAASSARPAKDPHSGSEPSSTGFYALLFHTVRIMLYRPFLHNSLVTPILPLTMQPPHSRCRDSAVAISEIAEKMVLEQRSYRQLFNSIHVSLCAAATVHRFVIASPKPNSEQPAGSEVMDDHSARDKVVGQGSGLATTASSTPSTLTQAPSSTKSDLYYLALLLRILLNCGRFSIEKSTLRSVIDGYLPEKHLSPQDLAWARDEIHRSFTIVPFAIRIPLQTTGRSNAVVSINLAPSSTSGTQQYPAQHQPQSQRRRFTSLPPQQAQQTSQKDDSGSSNPSGQVQQNQQYQQRLWQHQQDQQRAKQRAQTKRLNTSMADAIPGASHRMASPDGYSQGRSARRSGSFAELPVYSAAITPSNLSSPTFTEQLQYQQHQRELDMLQQHHRQQQTALNQHHQQQALQLEQAQMYNQQQQSSQAFMPQSQSPLYNQQPQQQPNTGAATMQIHTRNRLSGSGIQSPKSPYAKLPEQTATRHKRHSEPLIKEQQTWQADRQQQPQDPQERQEQHQQQDSYMADASTQDMDSPQAFATLSALGDERDETLKTNSAPSGNEQFSSCEHGLMTARVGTQRRRSSGTNITPDHTHYHFAHAAAPTPPSTPATPTTPTTPFLLYAIYLHDSFPCLVPPAIVHLYDYFDFVTTSDDYDNDLDNDNDAIAIVNHDHDFNNDFYSDYNNDYNPGYCETDEYRSYTTSPMAPTIVISHMTGTTDLSGNSGIASLDELLGLDHAGYYSEMPAADDAQQAIVMPPQAAAVPYVGFHAVTRPVPFAAGNPYAYAADGNSHMGQGPYQFDHVPSAAQQRQPLAPMGDQQMSAPQQQRQEQKDKLTQQHQQAKDLQERPKLEQYQRRMDQGYHPFATLLPPLPPVPQTMHRDDFRSFSPAPSNSSTLVNPSSVSNSGVGSGSGSGDNSQQDSCRGGSSGRETSTGGDTSSRGGSAPLDSSSNSGSTSDSAAMTHSLDSSTGGSNESASNTESPNSTEGISNSNESSGSSSENNAGSGSRSSSIDPVTGGASHGGANVETDGVDGGKPDSNTDVASSTTGSGSSGGDSRRRRRGKKSVSPSSGSNDSSASSSGATGDTLPSSAKGSAGSAGSGNSSSGSGTRPGSEFNAGTANAKGLHHPSNLDGSHKNRSNRPGKGKGGEKHRRTKSGGHGVPAAAAPTATTAAS